MKKMSVDEVTQPAIRLGRLMSRQFASDLLGLPGPFNNPFSEHFKEVGSMSDIEERTSFYAGKIVGGLIAVSGFMNIPLKRSTCDTIIGAAYGMALAEKEFFEGIQRGCGCAIYEKEK